MQRTASVKRPGKGAARFRRYLPLYLMLLPVIIYYLVFVYAPMGGLVIAFKDYNIYDGIFGSPWVGFRYFKQFFSSMFAPRLIRNTLAISLYNLVFGFTAPIILALMFNEVGNMVFKKVSQTISYLPYFISTVVIVSIMTLMFSMKTGIVNNAIVALGGKRINFMGEARFFKSMYVWSGVWQSMGFNSILYLSALTGVDPALHEAATIDGAGKWKQFFSITVPMITPIIFYNLVTQICQAFQEFNGPFIITNGGPRGSTTLISILVYNYAFKSNQMGMASALAWIMFVIVCILTIIAFTSQKKWVYYSDER